MKRTINISLPHVLVWIAIIYCNLSLSSEAEPKVPRQVTFMRLPLVVNSGLIEMWEVPVTLNGHPMASYGETMSAPVIAGSGVADDYKRDINLISIAKIKITFENIDQGKTFDWRSHTRMKIDVSQFVQPKQSGIGIYDIAQTILVCMRLNFPPGLIGKVEIEFVGAKDEMGLSKLEGPLWMTDKDEIPKSEN